MSLARFITTSAASPVARQLLRPSRGIFSVFDDPFFSSPLSSPFGRSLGKELDNTAFTRLPTFDVKETDKSFVLEGELPGVDKKDLELEFVDPQTLSVRGKVERSQETKVAEPEPAASEQPAESSESSSSKQGAIAPRRTYTSWTSERVYGEFSRAFRFPSRVNTEEVSASLKNGVLSINVPKFEPAPVTTKKIEITGE
ncbi:HSP20-like chaperone [Lipomyces japonicus]|uniref:HSP20-like chaperone n=1 Tax=Lipomyces japonicus TaxID=56871 RepID=UPI0034CF2087